MGVKLSSYKDLLVQEEKTDHLTALLQKCKGKTFEEFYDIIGRQERHGRKLGVLSYEKDLTETLERTKHLVVLKPVSSGITHYCIMWILWRIMRNDELQNSQVCIVVGPAVSLANRILGRIRNLLEPHGIIFDTAKNYLIINKCELFSVPSHNLNSLRSLERPAILYISESDYLPGSDFGNARECCEKYISKSNPWIIMESTIASSTGLFAQLFREENCLYTRKTINYLDALAEGMYTQRDIDKAKKSRSFEKELLCNIYALGNISSTFPPQWVERAFTMNTEINPTKYYLSCDPGWSPAKTGITLLGVDERTGMHEVIVAEEYDENESEIAELISTLKEQFNCRNIFIDAADKRLIKKIKAECTRDQVDYEAHITFMKKNKILSPYNPLKNLMTVVPLLFNQNSSREMLSYTRSCLEQSSVSIPSVCKSLERALYNATDIDGDLLKETLAHGNGSDVLDSFRMALWGANN